MHLIARNSRAPYKWEHHPLAHRHHQAGGQFSMTTLNGAKEWQRLFLVSPWISEMDRHGGMTLDQVVARLIKDQATAYVVTRPPVEAWHAAAVEKFTAPERANVVLVPELHAKLFMAETRTQDFALLGSANLTQKSLANRELGMLVHGFGDGRRLVRDLGAEAQSLYRLEGRQVVSKAKFSVRGS